MREDYSVFVSHANKDKCSYVDDLVEEIKKLNISVFYDKDSISWGDSIKGKIDRAMEQCQLAVVVISPRYFGRQWTEYELFELFTRQTKENRKIILPILYKVSKKDLLKNYPFLKDVVFKYAKSFSKAEMAQELKKELKKIKEETK